MADQPATDQSVTDQSVTDQSATDAGSRPPSPPRGAAHPAPAPAREPAAEPPPRWWRSEGMPSDGGRPGTPGAGGRPPWRRWVRTLLALAVGYLVVFAVLTMQDSSGSPTAVAYTEFLGQIQGKNVAEIFARGDTIQGTLKAAKPVPGRTSDTYTRFTTERPTFAQDDLLPQLVAGGTVVRATPVTQQRGALWNLLLSFAPFLLLIGFYLWLARRQAGALGGGLGGLGGRRSRRVDPAQIRVTFADVAGIDEVKAEIAEVVDFLKNPERYRRLGARVPKGVLLEGPPGTGKTLLARATAGEAEVPFFSASASEFIEMIVGVGAGRVRELFGEARKVAPSIIFIDEIDTIGRTRGGTTFGGHDEREQTLNQILTEMDGFSGAEGVVVLAATNRADVLDVALLRPGRFDRTITVQPPDVRGRGQILQVHTRSVPLAADVDLEQVARSTPGMTGADLANLVNEAALTAARRDRAQVTAADLADALERIQLGAARAVVMPDDERRRTAVHESGHALLGMLQPGADPVRKISIIPRGRALGVTLSTPETDRYGYDEGYLRGRIVGALGGMAAEEVAFGVVTTGAESDLETSTAIARNMVGRWGMSDRIGPVTVLPREGDPRSAGASDAVLGAVDAEVRRIVQECFTDAVRLLRDHRDVLDRLAEVLLHRETLDEAEAYAVAGIERGHAARPLLPAGGTAPPAIGTAPPVVAARSGVAPGAAGVAGGGGSGAARGERDHG